MYICLRGSAFVESLLWKRPFCLSRYLKVSNVTCTWVDIHYSESMTYWPPLTPDIVFGRGSCEVKGDRKMVLNGI